MEWIIKMSDENELKKMEKKALQGDIEAQGKLAYYHYSTVNLKEAFKWCKKAALHGDPNGQYVAGEIYLMGVGLPPRMFKEFPRDLEKGLNLLNKAAQQNHPDALHSLSEIYRFGKYGVPIDEGKADELLEKCEDNETKFLNKLMKSSS